MPKMGKLQGLDELHKAVLNLEDILTAICNDRDCKPYEMHHDMRDFEGTLYCIDGMYIVLAKEVEDNG